VEAIEAVLPAADGLACFDRTYHHLRSDCPIL